MQNRAGFTLLELALTLLVAGIIAGTALPALAHARDALAVRAARAELAAAFAITRVTAVRAGGAVLVLDTVSGTAWMERPGGGRFPTSFPLAERYGVTLSTDRTPPAAFRYDALGIGRLANGVIRLERRRVRATLTISAYGRVRS
jgi:prepilin-type N-terminal cleavage/methylation domain-containing protein